MRAMLLTWFVLANGFGVSVPSAVHIEKQRRADFDVYSFAMNDGAPFLRAYAGYAANFPYTAPPEGTRLTESPTGERLLCGEMVIHETKSGDVTQVGGSVTVDGKRCGEVLVRGTAVDGNIDSAAVHFWYSGLTVEQEKVAREIINSVRERKSDPPPGK